MSISKSWFSYLTRTFALSLCTGLLLNFISCSVSSTSQEPKAINSTYTATKDSFSSMIASLTEDSTIVVTGELTLYDLAAIATAIMNSTYKVNLDLSQTTGLTSIPESFFYNCTKLSGITIPDSVTTIGNVAFQNCPSLSAVTIGNSVTSIGDNAFKDCLSLSSVTIGDSVTSIGSYAFHGCTSLSYVTIPDSVTSIGGYAFHGCTSFSAVTIGNSVTSIGDNAFEDCLSLSSVTIGDSVTSIGSNAFEACDFLSSVNIPDSVTSIGSYAFLNCYKLTSLIFTDTTTWYITSNLNDWNNKTGGTLIDVSDPATNAVHFTYTYRDCHCYKL